MTFRTAVSIRPPNQDERTVDAMEGRPRGHDQHVHNIATDWCESCP